jgi:hypothetical protein
MIAHPLPAISIARAGEDVKANLGPTIHPLSKLNRFVLGVVRWIKAFRGEPRARRGITALCREVAMQLQHGGLGCDCVGTVDLDLIIVLRFRQFKVSESQNTENE